tara:strand:+ start:296 stop:556 length:261 start_codon:yes stop_codon:yes gene_type:complete
MSNSSNASGGGIGICGFLFLIFLTLKLAEVGTVATWSWWWVTSPLWIPIGIMLSILAIILLFAGIAFLLTMLFGKKVKPVRLRRAR